MSSRIHTDISIRAMSDDNWKAHSPLISYRLFSYRGRHCNSDPVVDNTWKTQVNEQELRATVKNSMLVDVVFCGVSAGNVQSIARNFGRDGGDARHIRPAEVVEGNARFDCMERLSKPECLHDREDGILYIMNTLEFGQSQCLSLSTNFELPLKFEDTPAWRAGWQIGSNLVEAVCRHVTLYDISPDNDHGISATGEFIALVLIAHGKIKKGWTAVTEGTGEIKSTLVTYLEKDHLEQSRNDTWKLEMWHGMHVPGVAKSWETCESLEDAQRKSVAWIAGKSNRSTSYIKEYNPNSREDEYRIYFREGCPHPTETNVLKESGTNFTMPPTSHNPKQLFNFSGPTLSMSMELHLYPYSDFAWVGVCLNSGAWIRSCVTLEEEFQNKIPPGMIGQYLDVRNPVGFVKDWEKKEVFPGFSAPTSSVRVVRVTEDFVELFFSSKMTRVLTTLQVLGNWLSIILPSKATVVFVFDIEPGQKFLERGLLVYFVLATLIFVWLEVRLSLQCATGRILYFTQWKTFFLALGLSALEKYDVNADLNFIQTAKAAQPDGWIWRGSLAIFIVGVLVMQVLPSLLLLISCTCKDLTKLGVPNDMSLLCRFSGMHVLMQSINPEHSTSGANVGAIQTVGMEEEMPPAEGQSQMQIDNGEMPSGPDPKEESSSPHQRAPADGRPYQKQEPAEEPLEKDSMKHFEVCPKPNIALEDILRLKEIARVKKAVGFVRLLGEDVLQGICHLLLMHSQWGDLDDFTKSQVILSVSAGVTVSLIGPILEQRKFTTLSKKEFTFHCWKNSGGEMIPQLEELLALEEEKYEMQADGSKVFKDGIGSLKFERHIVGFLAPEATDDVPVRHYPNGTTAKPGQPIRGKIICGPDRNPDFAGCIIQYILGFGDERGGVSQMQGLYNGCPGRNPQAREITFEIIAPALPGTYPVAWHMEMQYTMDAAMENWQENGINNHEIIGFFMVVEA